MSSITDLTRRPTGLHTCGLCFTSVVTLVCLSIEADPGCWSLLGVFVHRGRPDICAVSSDPWLALADPRSGHTTTTQQSCVLFSLSRTSTKKIFRWPL